MLKHKKRFSLLRLTFTSLALVSAACSDAIPLSAPGLARAPSAGASVIYCDSNNVCYSDGTGAGGSQQLTASVRSGCLKSALQQVPGNCYPSVYGIGGGSPGSSYTVRWFQSHCNSDDAEIGPGYCEPNTEIPAPPTITFTEADYEIDVVAEIQEVGGSSLTGVAEVQIMGPASTSTGSGFAVPCPSNSGSMFNPFPFRSPAINPSTGEQLTDDQGRPLFKHFAHRPCDGLTVFDPAPPSP